jgi:hypothetical protein
MKKFDRYSTRGLILTVISTAGIVYEVFFSSLVEAFVIGFYGLVLVLGLFLLFIIRDKST